MHEEDLPRIFSYIGGVIRDMGGLAIEVGGRPDHIHILCSLPKSMAITDFVRVIKSSSSKWIKVLGPKYKEFSWQDGYGAFSVSPTMIDKTIDYIKSQYEHHKVRTFREEYELFLKAYNVKYDEKYIDND